MRSVVAARLAGAAAISSRARAAQARTAAPCFRCCRSADILGLKYGSIRGLARDQQKWVPVLRPSARRIDKLAHDLIGEPDSTSPDHALAEGKAVCVSNGLIGI